MNQPQEYEAPALLREARLAAGLEIEAAVLATRIPVEQIRALEDGRYADLPGPAYARAFARTLAGAYGLDPEAIVAAVRRDLREPVENPLARYIPPTPPRLHSPNTTPELPEKGKSRSPMLLVGALGVAFLVLIGLTRIKNVPSSPVVQTMQVDSAVDTAKKVPVHDSVPAAPTPKTPTPRTISVTVRDTGHSAFLLYIRSARVRKSTLEGRDSLVLDPDSTTFFRNLSGFTLRLSGAIARDSVPEKYFRLDRGKDSVRVTISDEREWKKLYDPIMDSRKTQKRHGN